MLQAKVIRVIDGDSIEVEIPKMTLRLDFIDAPEKRGVEKEFGIKSLDFLASLLKKGDLIDLDIKKEDTYNRFLTVIYKDDVNVNGEMLKEGHAEVYTPFNHNNGKKD